MSIAMMIDNPAGTRELYERILDHLGEDVPLGGTLHVAGPSPTGGWRVIEVWDDAEQARRFMAERFAPALRAAGFEGQPPTPQFWPVHVCESAEATHDPGDARAGAAR